jgi:hypothetical protein
MQETPPPNAFSPLEIVQTSQAKSSTTHFDGYESSVMQLLGRTCGQIIWHPPSWLKST